MCVFYLCSIWFYVTSLNVFHVSSDNLYDSFTLYNYFIVLFKIAFILIQPLAARTTINVCYMTNTTANVT